MKSNFKSFIGFTEYLEFYQALDIPESFDWAKSYAQNLPKINLNLPTIQKQAKILILHQKNNPIFMKLSDGSQLYFTYDEFKRIHGQPRVGATMQFDLQRLPHDTSETPSKIVHCKII